MKTYGDISRRLAFTLLVATSSLFAATQITGPDLSSMGRLAKRKVDAINSGLGAQTSLCLNKPDCESQAGPAGTQAETTIAVDSTGQHVVIGFNDFRGFANAAGTDVLRCPEFHFSSRR